MKVKQENKVRGSIAVAVGVIVYLFCESGIINHV